MDPVAAAWSEYLETLRAIESEWVYEEVEAWAWERLLKRLRAVGRPLQESLVSWPS
jgi:hypothetical protein